MCCSEKALLPQTLKENIKLEPSNSDNLLYFIAQGPRDLLTKQPIGSWKIITN